MPELSRFFGIIISVFFEEHDPPHIHASHGSRRRPEWVAQIAIRNGEVLAGYVPVRDLRLVRRWIRLHPEELLEAWDVAQAGGTPKKIKPLRVR